MTTPACVVNPEVPSEYKKVLSAHGRRMARGAHVLKQLVEKGLAAENELKLFNNNLTPTPCRTLLLVPLVEKLEAINGGASKLNGAQKAQVKSFISELFISPRGFAQLNSDMDSLLKSIGIKPKHISNESRLIQDLVATVTPVRPLPPQNVLPSNQQSLIAGYQESIRNQVLEISIISKNKAVEVTTPEGSFKFSFGAEANSLDARFLHDTDGRMSNTIFKLKPSGEITAIEKLDSTGKSLFKRAGPQITLEDYEKALIFLSAITIRLDQASPKKYSPPLRDTKIA